MNLASTTLVAHFPDAIRSAFRPFAEGDAEMIKDIYLHQHYDFLELKSGDMVFDVGAHIGSFALKAARLVGEDGIVVAFAMTQKKIREDTPLLRSIYQ